MNFVDPDGNLTITEWVVIGTLLTLIITMATVNAGRKARIKLDNTLTKRLREAAENINNSTFPNKNKPAITPEDAARYTDESILDPNILPWFSPDLDNTEKEQEECSQ